MFYQKKRQIQGKLGAIISWAKLLCLPTTRFETVCAVGGVVVRFISSRVLSGSCLSTHESGTGYMVLSEYTRVHPRSSTREKQRGREMGEGCRPSAGVDAEEPVAMAPMAQRSSGSWRCGFGSDGGQ